VKWIEKSAMFFLGGVGYVSLELVWRGWSHFSMFLAGGSCFLLLGQLDKVKKTPLWIRGIFGSAVITAVELMTGLIFNRGYQVWDYRGAPMNFLGQICLPFTVLWMPISVGAMLLYRTVERKK
jgi:uncharacterized membrane protein